MKKKISPRVAMRQRDRRSRWSAKSWLVGQGDFVIAISYLMALALLGGGVARWSLAYICITIATIIAAVMLAWRDGYASLRALPVAAQIGLFSTAAIPLLQLIPLPPAVWRALPGQDLRFETMSLAGMADTWQPSSLEPVSTALVAVLAIGFVTLIALLLRLTDAQFRRTLLATMGLLLVGIAVGLLQVVSDGWPELQVNNMGGAMLGFFANKNHMALAIACGILLVGLVVARNLLTRERSRMVVGGFTLFALVCIVTTNSRAGLILAGIATAIVFVDLARGVAMRWRIAALATFVLLVAAVISSDAFQTVSNRVGEVDDDLRWSFLSWSWPLIERYWLIGSGLGSFSTLFATAEQLAWVKPTYVNAVHNDYFQLVLEAGVPGALALLALAIAVVGRVSAWRAMSRRNPQRAEMAAGFAILLLFALHSVVDYPLRRPAAWIFAAVALAAVFRSAITQAGTWRAEPSVRA